VKKDETGSAHVHHVAVLVEDLERAQRLFTEGFGFSSGPIRENAKIGIKSVFLDAENVKLELIQAVAPGPYWDMKEKGLIGMNHIAFRVGDFEPALKKLEKFGVKPKGEPAISVAGTVWDLDPKTTSEIRIQIYKQP